MRLVIEKVNNGFVLDKEPEVEGFNNITVVEEIQDPFDSTNENELKTVQNLLYEIMEYYGVFNSKHNKYRLDIEIVNQEEETDDPANN